jgi:hypothetical protein
MESVMFDGSQPVTPVGHYTYLVEENAWSWSDGLYLMHGYEPREVPATTEVMLRHKHPDDRSRAAGVLDAATQDGHPFSCYHRIIDRHERVRNVLSVGRGIEDTTGRVERVEGYFVDMTNARREETEAAVSRALAGIAQYRETIDLAKGMIMIATGADPRAAFETLRRYSQNTNIKLHAVAQLLVDAAAGDPHPAGWVIEFLDGLPRA